MGRALPPPQPSQGAPQSAHFRGKGQYLNATKPMEVLKALPSSLGSPSRAVPAWLEQHHRRTEQLLDTTPELSGTHRRRWVCDSELCLSQGSRREEGSPEASQSGSTVAAGLGSTRAPLQTHLSRENSSMQVCCQGPQLTGSPTGTGHTQDLISTDFLPLLFQLNHSML